MAGPDPLPASIFRRYDVRGVAGTELREETALLLGRALGSRIRRAGGTNAAVGRDVRHSSPGLAAAAARGLARSGLEVLELGVVSTPVLNHALHVRQLGGGIMVTGSHNPREDNGLKLCLGSVALHGEDIQALRRDARAGRFEEGPGRIRPTDHVSEYRRDLIGRFAFARRLWVGVDCGNGVMGPIALSVLRPLGVEVEPLYCEPDGDFPNHLPDPEVPRHMADLSRLVRDRGLELGLGFDGDGDRVGVLDETGRKISADRVLLLFARDMLAAHPGGRVRYDVKCSEFLAGDIEARGGEPVMGETGHSLLKRDVRRLDAILGGELSGHIVFNRGWHPIDDGLYAALRLLALLASGPGPLSALFADMPDPVSTAEIKVPCPDADKERVVAALVRGFSATHEVLAIDGARVRVAGGWFLVRASNTTPNLTVRIEARDLAALRGARDLLLDRLRAHPEVDPGPLLAEVP
jgi:phosphomannomutase/phosphoglucomutase